MDVSQATTFTFGNTGGNIGIVSFRNMPADEANGTTITLIHTQNSSTPAGFGNTTAATGIGTNIFISPIVGGTIQAGISTRGQSDQQLLSLYQPQQQIKILFHSLFTTLVVVQE